MDSKSKLTCRVPMCEREALTRRWTLHRLTLRCSPHLAGFPRTLTAAECNAVRDDSPLIG